MLRTSIENNYGKKVFVVNTGINKSAYKAGITNSSLKDEKGNDIFTLSIKTDKEAGAIGSTFLECNGYDTNGNLVVTIPVAEDAKLEDLKVKYGRALVYAADKVEKLAEQMAKESRAVDAIFATQAE